MKTFKIWEKTTETTNALHHSEVADNIETLGRNECIENYKIISVYRPQKDLNRYCSVTAKIIKKNGEIGKKTLMIKSEYEEAILGTTAKVRIYTKQ